MSTGAGQEMSAGIAVVANLRGSFTLSTSSAAAIGFCLAAAGGLAAAAGWGVEALALLVFLILVLAGSVLAADTVRALVLATVLLTPDFASGRSWGLLVHWSRGLTLSNYLIPAVALPLLLGAGLAGRRLFPHPWPGFARGYLWLLAWSALTLLPPLAAGRIHSLPALTLAAHWGKIVACILLGVILCGGSAGRLRRILFCGIAANAAVGLGQAASLLPVFSQLARNGTHPRATGFFFDANMYGVLMAWALLWLACELDEARRASRASAGPAPAKSWRPAAYRALALLTAASLVASGSRAAYFALAAGCAYLLIRRQPRPVLGCALLLLALAALFPARGWVRIQTAAATVRADLRPPAVTRAAPLDASTQARMSTMRQAWREFAAHPVLGQGFGRALYLGVPGVPSGPVRSPHSGFHGAQNMYLTVLAGTGPVGLLLLLAAVAAPLRQRWSGAALAIPAGFAGVLAACATNELLWNARILILLVLLTSGLLIGPAAGGREDRGPEPEGLTLPSGPPAETWS